MIKELLNIKLISLFVILTLLICSSFNGVYGEIVELTDKNFDKMVKKDERWFIVFYRKESKLYGNFEPTILKLSEVPESEMGFELKYGRIEYDENPHLVSRFIANQIPQYFISDLRRVYSFTITQNYDYVFEFLKYRRWKLFPVKEGASDPFSYMAYFYGYFNIIGFLLKKNVFIYIPPKIFYSTIIGIFFSAILRFAYRKHREVQDYINKFERDIEEKYYERCEKHGYDPFKLIEEMEKKIKRKGRA